jgi:hypothetical protein
MAQLDRVDHTCIDDLIDVRVLLRTSRRRRLSHSSVPTVYMYMWGGCVSRV